VLACSLIKQFHNDSHSNTETNRGMRNIISVFNL